MYQVTGNEFVSLPQIRQKDGVVENLTFLYMQAKGMIEMVGNDALMQPYFQVDGRAVQTEKTWSRAHYWIPACTAVDQDVRCACTYLSPVGERGFVLHLTMKNQGQVQRSVRMGVCGEWLKTNHRVNETLTIEEGRSSVTSGWNHMFVFRQRPGLPLFAFAPITSDDQPYSQIDQGADWILNGYRYDIGKNLQLEGGEEQALDVFFGLGYEEVAAATSAKEMLRQGYDALLEKTESWLAKRERKALNPQLTYLLNTNLFFSFFFATGRTIDTEELVMVTSRSPRYYVSAAYWDRDSLLWAFPSVLVTDCKYAKELLLSVYRKQGRNFGIHSRYIDGTVLEPGFELDELCAPVIALKTYVDQTHDRDILKQPVITERLEDILEKLEERRHPNVTMYSTFLQPTDDMHCYPYLTYDNALVVYVLRALGDMLDRPQLTHQAEQVKAAVEANCRIIENGRMMYAWSVNLQGQYDIYDEPPGSLQLLPWYGFCNWKDTVWLNTVAYIRNKDYELSFSGHPIAEIGCKHAPHPWVLSMCNSLLSGHTDTAVEHLNRTKMDNGIACESVNEDNGLCETGAAFATCAGFLSFALLHACGE